MVAICILPKLSKIHDRKKFKKVVFNFYKAGIPLLAIGLYIIYALRPYLVFIIFSEEFRPVEQLFAWQLLGDFVKVLSMVIAYQFLAKKMFWYYVLTEAFLIVILYKTSIYFIDLYNSAEGAVVAHFVSYCMYYAIVLLIFVSSLFGVDNSKIE